MLKTARWHNHINHVQASKQMRHWLTETGSLTKKLIAHSAIFRVQRIYQQPDFCWVDEYAAIALKKRGKVHAREVLLRCDDMPTVYAHTVLPLNSDATQWPRFKSLGEKSLGSTLFNDAKVTRGNLQFARLPLNHPAMQRAQYLIQHKFKRPLFARRSLFFRCGGIMLVTELFLPAIAFLPSPLCRLSRKDKNSLLPLAGEGSKTKEDN